MSSADELQQELMTVRRNAIELHSADQVQEAIAKLAFEVTEACSGKVPVFVTIMNGGMIFAAELVKRLDFPLEMDALTDLGTANHLVSLTDLGIPLKIRCHSKKN